MPRKSSTRRIPHLKFGWRKLAVISLTFLGLAFFVGFTTAHWVERQLLTTDNYVNLVAPLPKDEQVSSALADYSVNKLFTGIDLEAKIAQALPDKAAFLAAPLTERVNARADQLAQSFIQSDQFQGIWISANRQAHHQLVDRARGDIPLREKRAPANLGIKLGTLTQNIREKLGITSEPLFSQQSAKTSVGDITLVANLKSSFETFKRYVQAIDFFNGVLWLASLACLIGAIAISHTRRRLLLIILAAISVISLLQLIGVRVLRPEVINQVEQVTYRPAAEVIYDSLLASFKRGATSIFTVSTISFAVLLLFRLPAVTKNKYLAKWRNDFHQTAFWKTVCDIRVKIGTYRWPIVGTGAFLVLVFMAFVPEFDWQGLLRAVLSILIILGLVTIVAAKPVSKNQLAAKRS